MNKNSPTSSGHGRAPATSLTLLQRLSPQFFGFGVFGPSYHQAHGGLLRIPKVSAEICGTTSLPPRNGELYEVALFHATWLLWFAFSRLRIGNSYARPLPLGPHTFPPEFSLLDLEYPYLVGGDFNIKITAAYPSRPLSSREELDSTRYFDRASDLGITLLNTPGVYPPFPLTGTHSSSIIDLAFAYPLVFPAFGIWETCSLPSTGSDNALILTFLLTSLST